MFGFLRGYSIRWMFGLAGALPALAGGILVLVATLSTSQNVASPTIIWVFHAALGVGALLAASRIYKTSKALLFARARMSGAGILAAVIGGLLYIVGFGFEGLLVIAGGVVAIVGAHI